MIMLQCVLLTFAVVIIANFADAQDKWVWAKGKNQKILGYYPAANKKVYYTNDPYARADRDREPTTKRPLPGEPANDDIDDYNDNDTENPPSKQNSPYPAGGFGGQFGGTQYGGGVGGFDGFNQYPQFGGGAVGPFPNNPTPNGILVGPGGPTGIIGRPQAQYPGAGYPGYPSYNTPPPSYAGAVNTGYPGYNGLGQYPYAPNPQPTYPNPHQQFAAGPQYPGPQYAPATAHQFTEGYGLSAQPQPGGYQPNPQQNFNGYPAYPQGFSDEYVPPQVEGKSARVKASDKKIDDKISKNLKKS